MAGINHVAREGCDSLTALQIRPKQGVDGGLVVKAVGWPSDCSVANTAPGKGTHPKCASA